MQRAFSKAVLEETYRRTGNLPRGARALGISAATFAKLLREAGVPIAPVGRPRINVEG